MAGQKITDLTKITTVAEDDLLVAVDVSDTGMGASGSNKGLQKRSLFLSRDSGWIPVTDTWEYLSADDPTGVLTVPSDATTKYSIGMKIQFVNGGNIIFGIITALTSETITFLHEIDPTVQPTVAKDLIANSEITLPYFSTQKAPFGFPTNEAKWSISVTITTDHDTSGVVVGTWYQYGNISINIPIGLWKIRYVGTIRYDGSSEVTSRRVDISLSTATGSESHSELTLTVYAGISGATFGSAEIADKLFELDTKDTYYLIGKGETSGTITRNRFNGVLRTAEVIARCAYL